MVGHCRDTCGWALQGHLVVGHYKDTWWLGTTGTLGGWALQGHLVVGHCRDIWWLGTAGTLGGWALQGHLVVGHCRDTWWLGTAGTLGGWALQGHLVVGHYRDSTAGTLGGWALKSACSRASTTSSLKSNNPTVRVGNKKQLRSWMSLHMREILILVGTDDTKNLETQRESRPTWGLCEDFPNSIMMQVLAAVFLLQMGSVHENSPYLGNSNAGRAAYIYIYIHTR